MSKIIDQLERKHRRFLAGWLASQFTSCEQLRCYLQLSQEERCACFPGRHLDRLRDADWQAIGDEAVKQLSAISPN